MFACLNPGTVGGGLGYEEFVALAKRHGFPAVEFGIEWLAEKASKEGMNAARDLVGRSRHPPRRLLVARSLAGG